MLKPEIDSANTPHRNAAFLDKFKAIKNIFISRRFWNYWNGKGGPKWAQNVSDDFFRLF